MFCSLARGILFVGGNFFFAILFLRCIFHVLLSAAHKPYYRLLRVRSHCVLLFLWETSSRRASNVFSIFFSWSFSFVLFSRFLDEFLCNKWCFATTMFCRISCVGTHSIPIYADQRLFVGCTNTKQR